MRTTLSCVFASFLALCSLAQTLYAAEFKLGVLAPRGELETQTRWSTFADYLGAQIGQKITVVPLNPSKVVPAAESREVNLVLGNAIHMAYLQERLGSTPVATINGEAGARFAGVIVAKKGSGIQTAEHLKGKKVMALDFKTAAGAYMFQAYHLLKKGIDPHKDFATLKDGKKQDDLVLAVKAGLIDAAFVRSGLLEAMEKEGKLKIADFEIVDARQGDGLGLVHSTDLYPEWYLAATSQVAPEMAAQIKAAVLRMKPEMEVTKALGVKGFVEPLSLDGVKEMLRALKIPPYDI